MGLLVVVLSSIADFGVNSIRAHLACGLAQNLYMHAGFRYLLTNTRRNAAGQQVIQHLLYQALFAWADRIWIDVGQPKG